MRACSVTSVTMRSPSVRERSVSRAGARGGTLEKACRADRFRGGVHGEIELRGQLVELGDGRPDRCELQLTPEAHRLGLLEPALRAAHRRPQEAGEGLHSYGAAPVEGA